MNLGHTYSNCLENVALKRFILGVHYHSLGVKKAIIVEVLKDYICLWNDLF